MPALTSKRRFQHHPSPHEQDKRSHPFWETDTPRLWCCAFSHPVQTRREDLKCYYSAPSPSCSSAAPQRVFTASQESQGRLVRFELDVIDALAQVDSNGARQFLGTTLLATTLLC
jgi:hypothetical protein